MSNELVPASLRELLADIFEITPEKITPELNMAVVENWDSFRHLQVILAIEGEYGVQFDPQRIPELSSVNLLLEELQKKGATL